MEKNKTFVIVGKGMGTIRFPEAGLQVDIFRTTWQGLYRLVAKGVFIVRLRISPTGSYGSIKLKK